MIVEKILSIKTDTIINISENEQRLSKEAGFPKSKLKLITNSVVLKTPSFPARSPYVLSDSIKLVFVGRFSKQKGLDILLKSFEMANKNIELMVIGDAADKNNFRTDSQSISSPRIHFMGWIDNEKLDSYLKFADAMVIPSRWEGFGLVALEGMKNKLALIASDIPTLSDIVINEQTGVLFKAGDSESLAAQINRLSHGTLKKMGKAGKLELEKKYNSFDMNEKIMDTYK